MKLGQNNYWIGNIGQISAKLDQKCRFSIAANFFGQSQILGIPLYVAFTAKNIKLHCGSAIWKTCLVV